MDPDTPSRPFSSRAMAGISFIMLLFAWGAYDDITTDPAPSHAFEYFGLLLIAVWFCYVAIRLFGSGHRILFSLILAVLSAAGISTTLLPPQGVAIPPIPRALILAAFVFLLFLTAWLLAQRTPLSNQPEP